MGESQLTSLQQSEDLERLRPKLMAFFRWNRCESPEDGTQETMSRALERINDPETVIHVPLQIYVFGIARNVLHELRRAMREIPMDPGGVEFSNISADSTLSADDGILVQECIAVLPKEDQIMVLDYHRKGAAQLAKEMGTTANAVRIRAHRIHRKVQELMVRRRI